MSFRDEKRDYFVVDGGFSFKECSTLIPFAFPLMAASFSWYQVSLKDALYRLRLLSILRPPLKQNVCIFRRWRFPLLSGYLRLWVLLAKASAASNQISYALQT